MFSMNLKTKCVGVNVIRMSVENPVVIVDFSPGVGSGDVGRKVRTP